ncbi:MAG: sugar ABC transporter permease [Lachnospiraceae bacterium]|nr:sugar ABC transporter permease [Lachnospiraceae bacterium]
MKGFFRNIVKHRAHVVMALVKGFFRNIWKHRAHVVMALPVFLLLFFIMYVPMSGLLLAFKDSKDLMERGLYGARYNNFENFRFIIQSKTIFIRMLRNTFKYYVIFTAIGTLLNVTIAIAIDQFIFKRVGKTMQTLMIIPVFISYAAVQFIVEAFISKDLGIINRLLGTSTGFYSESKYWPTILTLTKIWKDTGYGSVLYMSVLAGIDSELYEAAEIDGAGRFRRIWHITLPSLIPMITVMLLLSVGNIMKSDTGLFYQVTRNGGAIKETTEVIDSYILGQIKSAGINSFGYTAASSLFQSVVGLLMMLFANFTVRKIEPENALF